MLWRTTFQQSTEFYVCRYRLCRFCKGGSFGSPHFCPKMGVNVDVNIGKPETYRISEIPSKKHKSELPIIL
jgi:hypothetical protein